MTVKISELPEAVAFDGSEQIPLVQSGVTVRSPLGTAATEYVTASATDTTAGRLLKVGDFGVGGDAVFDNADLNAEALTGFYWKGNAAPNNPTGNAGSLLQITRDLQSDTQIYTEQVFDRIFFRRQEGGSWAPWRELFHTGNLLGTVSQAAGVPTGAVIEQGSSLPAGQPEVIMRRWTRFADGTQIVYVTFRTQLTATNGLYDIATPVSFPQSVNGLDIKEASIVVSGGVVVDIVTNDTVGNRLLTGTVALFRNVSNALRFQWTSTDAPGGTPTLGGDSWMLIHATVTGRWFV